MKVGIACLRRHNAAIAHAGFRDRAELGIEDTQGQRGDHGRLERFLEAKQIFVGETVAGDLGLLP